MSRSTQQKRLRLIRRRTQARAYRAARTLQAVRLRWSQRTLQTLRYVWAGPTSIIGLAVCFVAWVSGSGTIKVRNGVMEGFGGFITWFLTRGIPGIGSVPAMGLGHVVLAVDARALRKWRAHELVHVRQAERWGPLFLAAYCWSSIAALLRGDDPYYDNVFEREAYGIKKSPACNPLRPRLTPRVVTSVLPTLNADMLAPRTAV